MHDATASPTPLHELYRDHHGWLYGLLNRKLGNAGDAADLAHDVFLRLWTTPRRFDSRDGARAYLSTVAKGRCIDLWRRREIERAWLEVLMLQPEAVAPSAEDQAAMLETLYRIDAMLHQLSARTADAFVMAMVYGMTDKEIAAQLRVSDRMVRKYTANAMLHCMLLEAELSGQPAPARLACA
jgi:RNA polymerase sigma-70 factor (ECF subfamily)